MPNTSSRDHSRTEHNALVERVILLRSALKGLTHDHASLHRKASLHRTLSRARTENAALRSQLRAGVPGTRGGAAPR